MEDRSDNLFVRLWKKLKSRKKLLVTVIIILLIVIAGGIFLLTKKNGMPGTGKAAGFGAGGAFGGGMSGNGMPGGMPGAGMNKEAAYPMVRTMHPGKGSVSVKSSLTGTVESSGAVYVYSEASGTVTAVNVKVGDQVSEGDILCEIDTGTVDSARNSMESAQISRDQAAANLARMEILHSGGDITEQEYEQARNQARTSELQYENAKSSYEKQLKGASVASPISGKVQSCSVAVNDKVGGNQVIFVIVGEGNKRISFFVSERIMEHLAQGDSMWAIRNGKEYPGHITSVNTIVDDYTGLFECTAELDETDTIAIGSTVRIDIISDHSDDVLTVPVDAVYYSGGDAYLYVIKDGKASVAEVELGLYDDETAEIVSGVTEEDEVISTWSNNLYEGASVRVESGDFDVNNLEKDESKKTDQNRNGGSGGGPRM